MIKKTDYKVAVIGLGYVGLPLYLLCEKNKINIKGFDINKFKINKLKRNISDNTDISSADLKRAKKNFFSMHQIKSIKDRNFIIFCLPTPLTKKNYPDLSYIMNALKIMKNFCSSQSIFVLESTVYPGATNEIFSKYLTNLNNDQKILNYGFSSERIDPGTKKDKSLKITYEDIPKIISGNSKSSQKKIKFFYGLLFKSVIVASSIEVAEMSKLLENSYRSVNIGLINEIKMLCHRGNINFHDVISAASSKPFGFNTFSPGPGVGGHCIPIDPIFLNWYANKIKGKADLITIARKKNLDVTKFVNKNILRLLKKINSKKEKKILIIGVAYKKDINDYRESPSLKIINNFIKKKIKFNYYDPYIDSIKLFNKKIKSIKNLNRISSYDIVTLVTDHTNLPYKKILSKSKILIDTRGYYAKYKNKNIIFL